ncbi:hypothetical protein D9M68_978150 [compost metagenome]
MRTRLCTQTSNVGVARQANCSFPGAGLTLDRQQLPMVVRFQPERATPAAAEPDLNEVLPRETMTNATTQGLDRTDLALVCGRADVHLSYEA